MGGGGGGGVATAVPAAAVQKPRKNINLSEKVTLSRPIGRIGRNSLPLFWGGGRLPIPCPGTAVAPC